MNLLLERRQPKTYLPLNVKDEGNMKFKKPSRKDYQNKVAETDVFSAICIIYVRTRHNQLASQTNEYAKTFELIISIILAFVSIIGIIIMKYFRNQLEKEEIQNVVYFASVGMLFYCIFAAIFYP
eukprot:296785_1